MNASGGSATSLNLTPFRERARARRLPSVLLHGAVAPLLAVATILWAGGNARAGQNVNVRLALDVRELESGVECQGLVGSFPSCDSIRTSLAGLGDFQAVVVLYGFREMSGAEFTLTWPSDWTIYGFQPCSDFSLGGDPSENPMEVVLAWSDPLDGDGEEGAAVGILQGRAESPGCISLVEPDSLLVRAGVADGDARYDPLVE